MYNYKQHISKLCPETNTHFTLLFTELYSAILPIPLHGINSMVSSWYMNFAM